MFRKKFPALIILAWLVFVSACNLPGAQPAAGGSSPEASVPLETQVARAVASTQAAAQTASASAAPGTPADTLTPPPVATQTFTPSPTFPMVTVSTATNCRSGPNTNYDLLGLMKVGEKAQVVGRSELSDTMIIKLPSNPAITCWLWAQYASVEGDVSGLPVVAIPPTPSPQYSLTPRTTPTPQAAFKAAYVSTDYCVGLHRAKFQISNSGGLTWESNRVTLTDQSTLITQVVTSNDFPYYNSACATGADQNLAAGEVGYTSSDGVAIDPAGHDMVATIRVCSLDGLAGTCLEQTVNFRP